MSVYVDESQGKYKSMKMCHMIADTEDELDAFAFKIGLRKEWKQFDKSPIKRFKPHYDLSLSKKRIAIQFGAKKISCLEGMRQGLYFANEYKARG